MLVTAAPPLYIARMVDAFWSFAGDGARHRVLPDGCIDFLFDLESGRARVIGPMLRAELVHLPATTRLFGVRFRPGAASAFLEVEASALVDTDGWLEDLTRAGRFCLAERVAAARDTADRCALVARFLNDTTARCRAIDTRVHTAIDLLSRHPNGLTIREVAAALDLSERQLERLFRDRMGVRPKYYARIARLDRALRALTAAPAGASETPHKRPTQARVALEAGYADESHLIRDFLDLVGSTPSALREERLHHLDGGPEPDVGFIQASRSGKG